MAQKAPPPPAAAAAARRAPAPPGLHPPARGPRPPLFAATPPAIFPPVLGLLGLGLALRGAVAGGPEALVGGVELALGLVFGLWVFAALAIAVKLARRPGVVTDDMRSLPGRAGYAALGMGGMAAAAVLVPHAPAVALWLVWAALAVHGVLALVLVRVLMALPAEGRGVNPAWHLAFVGFIVAAVPLTQLGHEAAARAILWATLPVAAAIWGVSLAQLLGRIPPAPLRPLLAIHLAPAALFATVAALTGQGQLAQAFAGFGAVIFAGLFLSLRWLTASGFSALWGAFTFPLATFATALMAAGGLWHAAGLAVTALALAVVPVIGWKVLRLWPGGRLQAATNAAVA